MNAHDALIAFASNFEGFHAALLVVCAAIGFWFVGQSVFSFVTAKSRERSGGGMMAPAYYAVAGTSLLSLPEIVKRQTETLLQSSDPRSILDYASPSGSEAAMLATVLVGLVTFFGWIAIARGWYLMGGLAGAGGGRSHDMGDVGIYLAAGTFLANILAFSDLFAATFATTNYLREIMAS